MQQQNQQNVKSEYGPYDAANNMFESLQIVISAQIYIFLLVYGNNSSFFSIDLWQKLSITSLTLSLGEQIIVILKRVLEVL